MKIFEKEIKSQLMVYLEINYLITIDQSAYRQQHNKHTVLSMMMMIIIIKCMCSRCRRDGIHVCFAYASPQRMLHMYDHKIVSLKYII